MMEPKNVVEMGIAHTQAEEKTGGKKRKPSGKLMSQNREAWASS
jgi:hypothetical protein